MARCMLEGGDAVDCGKKLVVGTLMEQVPEKARPITECLIGGGNVAKCAQDEALRNIPNADARNVAACVLGGTPVDKCGSRALIDQLPKEVQGVVKCVGDTGDVAGCAKKLAIDQLPAGKAKDFANCLNSGKNEAQCATQFGIGVLDPAAKKATDEALAAAKQVEAQMAEMTAKMPNLVKNIMKVAEGIRKEDWGLVIEGGGPEIAKLAANIIIEVILTPAIAPIAGPVIDAMIQTKSDAFFGLLKAINNGDVIGIAAVIFEYYARMAVDIPCALIPDGDFKDAVCGNLAKGIAKVIELGAGLAKDILEVGEDLAKLLGIYDVAKAATGFVGDVWEGIKDAFDELFGGGDGGTVTRRCIGMSPTQFYAQNFLACLKSQMDGPAPASVVQACHTSMWQCGIDNTAPLCGTMRPDGTVTPGTMQTQFDAFKNKIKATFPSGAENFTAQTFGAYAQGKGEAVCEDGYWDGPAQIDFSSRCAATIEGQAKLADNNCRTGNNRRSSSAAFGACRAALGRFDKVKATWDMCAGYRKKKEEWDRTMRPCLERGLGVSHEAGNPYVDLQKPFNLNECLGRTKPKDWGIGVGAGLGGGGVPTLPKADDQYVRPFGFGTSRPEIGLPGYVIPGSGSRTSSVFVTGSCRPGVPIATPSVLTSGSSPSGFGLKWEISIPASELKHCNTGSGGPYFVNARTNEGEKLRATDPVKLSPFRPVAAKPAESKSSGGSGGAYKVYQQEPRKSAIDTLGSLGGGGLDAVSGNRGYVAPQGGRTVPKVPCNTCGRGGSNTAQSGDAPAKPTPPKPTAPAAPTPSRSGPDPIDYGGCSSCGKPEKLNVR